MSSKAAIQKRIEAINAAISAQELKLAIISSRLNTVVAKRIILVGKYCGFPPGSWVRIGSKPRVFLVVGYSGRDSVNLPDDPSHVEAILRQVDANGKLTQRTTARRVALLSMVPTR